jgi:hypothetical protein
MFKLSQDFFLNNGFIVVASFYLAWNFATSGMKTLVFIENLL